MPNKWLGFMVFVWVILSFFASTFDKGTTAGGGWAGNTAPSKLEYLMNFKNISYQSTAAGDMNFVGINSNYFTTINDVIMWNYSFLDDYGMVKMIILVPFSILAVLALITMFTSILFGFIKP